MTNLRELTLQDELIFDDWIQAWKNEPTQVSVSRPIQTNFAEFIKQLQTNSRHPEAPRVPATKYFYIEANRIKGGISCRWKLNDYLLKFGGNIGYGVAPEFRNQGIASEMLQQALALFKARNIIKVLITAEDWNIASQQVINNAGGIYENTLMEESTGHHLQRYWITLK
ncbi:GNAT family N-acetyltransferase [Pediococcus parvulus]|uniref:GNAT family N-acetyltransferase n=1 Tax=Pediococcus parvulus TaxID=54062 RepID=UPI00070A91CE|nr:GNAT family N-acetyltransferase [Pediococcus parvulus]MCT3027866.1 GNAT family N-acetyltransferase [Pediococcus parvulus]GEL90507.1 acetyltransferase [Pediococcus parvulus]GHC12014.1 acetyltransferase [Pediococcus parvulus]